MQKERREFDLIIDLILQFNAFLIFFFQIMQSVVFIEAFINI